MVQMAPRRTAVPLLGLLAALTSFQTSTGLTSDLSCPAETFVCLGDSVCATCLETLQAADASFSAIDTTDCNDLYVEVCAVVEGLGCDITNSNLEAFAGCVAEEDFGCPDFVSCAAAESNVTATAAPAATPAPTTVTTTAPTDVAAAITTMAPSSAEDAVEADEDSGVTRTVAAAATRTAVALACGLALFLSV